MKMIKREIKIKSVKPDYFVFIASPIYPLIDYLGLGGRLPLATIIGFLLFLLLTPYKIKVSMLSFVFFVGYIFSILINTLATGWVPDYFLSILLLFNIFLLVSVLVRIDKLYNYLFGFSMVYFALNTAIYVVRLIRSNMDYFVAKGNMSFYGGNTAHLVYMIMFFLAVHSKKKRDSFILYVIMTLNAFLYLSRGAIIMQVLITLLIIVKKRVIDYKYRKKIYMTIPVACLLFYRMGVISALLEKMDIWEKSLYRGMSLIGDRSDILGESVSLLSDNIVYMFFGCGLGKFKYIEMAGWSNPHNMVMDAWFCGGIVGFGAFMFMVYKTYVYSTDNRFLYLLVVIYAIVEGVALFFVELYSSWMWGGSFLFLVSCYYLTKRSQQGKNELNRV